MIVSRIITLVILYNDAIIQSVLEPSGHRRIKQQDVFLFVCLPPSGICPIYIVHITLFLALLCCITVVAHCEEGFKIRSNIDH